jgi:hypothetical protein
MIQGVKIGAEYSQRNKELDADMQKSGVDMGMRAAQMDKDHGHRSAQLSMQDNHKSADLLTALTQQSAKKKAEEPKEEKPKEE